MTTDMLGRRGGSVVKIQHKRFWLRSPYGPHVLVLWLLGPDIPPKTPTAHCGYGRYSWNWRGQCIGVLSTRDFISEPICPKASS